MAFAKPSCTLCSVLDVILTLILGGSVKALKVQKIMRLMRLARVVKLIRGLKGVRSLFGTLIISLPAFWNVGALVFLMFFIYAYVGVLMFGKVVHNRWDAFWTTEHLGPANDTLCLASVGCRTACSQCVDILLLLSVVHCMDIPWAAVL